MSQPHSGSIDAENRTSSASREVRNRRGDILAGRYELLELIGRGGSGSVFRARDPRLGRQVAIKIAYPGDSRQRARLVREARIGAQLQHPNLMQVLDHGSEDACIYIVMPCVMGPTLRARLNAAPLPWQTAGIFVHQLLIALAVLHNAGVAHRDVKSDNCLLSHDPTGDRLILADFGLARIVRASLTDLPPHQTSQVIASLGYMAPERIDSQGDVRSDVYSAGIVLFEALTRRLPFRGTPDEVLWQHGHDPPTAASSLADVPPAFDELIATALAKDPGERFQTVGEFDAELLRLIRPEHLEVVPTAGVEQVTRALRAWEQCDVTGALDEAREAEVCDRRWRCLRELIEVVHEVERAAVSD